MTDPTERFSAAYCEAEWETDRQRRAEGDDE